jgi:hypothetical protein
VNQDQTLQLETILNASASRRRPVVKYSRMSTEKFVVIWHYLRTVEIVSSLIVVAGACRTRGSQISDAAVDEIMNLVEPPMTRPAILKLAEWYYEPGLFWVFAECMGEQPYAIRELDNRMINRQIGKHLAVIPATIGKETDISGVGKYLWADRRIKALLKPFGVVDSEGVRESEYETADLMQKSFVKALELIEVESDIKPVPLPPYPLPLRPDFQHVWDTDIANLWAQVVENDLGRIKAGLILSDDSLREGVRGESRNLWATDRRRLKILAVNHLEIQSEVHPEVDDRNLIPDVSDRMLKVLRIAKKRWGVKAVRALRYLFNGKTEEEAARLAGITTRTLLNYKTRLAKEFSQKNNF